MSLSFALWAMNRFNRCTFVFCGKSVGSTERNIINPLLAVQYLQEEFDLRYTRGDHLLTVRRGGKENYFYLFGGKDESSYALIQGITLAGVLLDEAALMPRSFVEQALARCSVDWVKFWFNCNPENPMHWFRNYYDYVDTLRESKLAPMLRRLLPVLAMSALGTVPEDLDISFPPLWTSTAKEVAEIARDKAETIVSVFQAGLIQAGLIQADTAQRELKKMSGETDLFDSITDEEIAANKGKTYQDVTALCDPLVGLGYGGEDANPFERTTGDELTLDFNPYHDPSSGRFTSGGGSDTMGKTKYAPSPQRNKSGIQLKPKSYARLCGILGTQHPNAKARDVRTISDAKKQYVVKADGYGGFTVMKIKKLK